MTTKCVRCQGVATTMACSRCTDRLRKMLAELPDWLAELETTATGQAKLGGSVRRSPRYRRPLDGDAHPLATFPNERQEDLVQARHEREEAMLRDALARGRVNARASDLMGKVHGVLVCWVRDLCETRGIEFPTFDEVRVCARDDDGQPPAPWVDASTVHVAAGDPGGYCGECFTFHQGECA